jgi:hypothetical protein
MSNVAPVFVGREVDIEQAVEAPHACLGAQIASQPQALVDSDIEAVGLVDGLEVGACILQRNQ